MFGDSFSREDMKSWFENHIQRIEEDLRSRNLCHLIKVDPQRRRRVFEDIFMISSGSSPSSVDHAQVVLCELPIVAPKYSPENIQITLKGREMTVHAREEEQFENGFSLHEIKRTFKIGEDIDLEKLSAHLSDTKIVIKASKVKATIEKRPETVEIKVKRIVENNSKSDNADLKETSKVEEDVKTIDVDCRTKAASDQLDDEVTSRCVQIQSETEKRDVDNTKHLKVDKNYELKKFELTKKDENEFIIRKKMAIESHSETETRNIELI